MKILLATIFSLFVLCYCATAQLSFVRDTSVQVIDDTLPLKNAWAGGLNFPMIEQMDLNGDGIMDIIIYEPGATPGHDRLMPFINLGDSGNVDYHYAPEYIPDFPEIKSWMVTYDYNCDGKMDLFSLSDACNCGIMAYRNDFTPATGLKFTKVADPIATLYYGSQLANLPANSVSVPAFIDVDGDGDMDIITWNPFSTNTLEYDRGLWADSGWSCDSLRFTEVTECWGKFVLTVGANLADLGVGCAENAAQNNFHENQGTARQDDTQSCICLYEQDGDTDKDAIIGGNNDNNMIYLRNGGNALKDSMVYEDYDWPVYNVPVNLASFPCAYNLDVDNDGKKDIIISPHAVNDYRGILYYKNTDIAADTPVFSRQPHTFLQEEMIEVGTAAAPQLFDYDCDGLPDMLIGDYTYTDTSGLKQGIALYKNIGTPTAPEFKLITRDFAGLNELNGLTGTFILTFGDLNNDGYLDMITGSSDGKLYYFQNTGCPANFIPPTGNYFNIDVGNYSAPQLYDLNHDGLLDLIVGNALGIIKYYKNIGNSTTPVFDSIPTIDTLGGIITQIPSSFFFTGYATPFFYDDSGIDKLVVGTQGGKVYVYDNINGNIAGTYHLADSLINGEEGQNLVPVIGDINNDGHPDMIIGNYNGGVSLFMNKYGTTGINELHKTVLSSFDAYPNPVSDELHLDFYHIEGAHTYFEIINSIGQVVYSITVAEQKMTLSLKNLCNGIYLARFVSANNAQSLKIVVRH